MLGDKLRLRFAKTGTLRLLSHHDLMRSTERMLRRAALPFKSTAGFHPTPRVHFALSLPLGLDGLDEVVEIEFTRELDAGEVLVRLNEQAPTGLRFTRASVVPGNTTAMPRRVVYRVPLPADRRDAAAARCAALTAQDKIWVDRLRPSPKRVNVRPYLRNLSVANLDREAGGEAHPLPDGPGSPAVELVLDLWVTPTGSARADELLKLLDLADLPDAGAVVARTTVELHDEVPNPDPADGPPGGPAETLPPDPAALAALTRRDDEELTAAAGWGPSPAGPVVE
jgi:radical SAM-linked protein